MQASNLRTFRITASDIPSSENAKFTGPIYADPSVKLYHALGMDVENLKTTPANQERPSYLTIGRLSNTLMSIWVRSFINRWVGRH